MVALMCHGCSDLGNQAYKLRTKYTNIVPGPNKVTFGGFCAYNL